MRYNGRWIVLGVLASSLWMGSEANALQLRFGDYLPPSHLITVEMTNKWIEAIENQSKGDLKVQYFPAEQAGKAKDLLSLTQSGVIDVGMVTASYIPDKMPLSGAAGLPGKFSTSCQAVRAFWPLIQEGGYLYENEIKKNKVRALALVVLPPYQIVVGKDQPIQGLNDLAGYKLRAAGGLQELELKTLGMTAVKMSAPEIYESMMRGTIDGALFPFVSVESYKMESLIKWASKDANFGAVTSFAFISDKSWKKLSKEQKEIISRTGYEATMKGCASIDQKEEEIRSQMSAMGTKFIEFSQKDRESLNQMVQQVARDFAENLNKRGLAGDKIVDVFEKAIDAAK